MKRFYEKGNFVKGYSKIVKKDDDPTSRAWRDGMISGNGLIGYVTSGEPYSDAFIFQHMYFNYPWDKQRFISDELPGQLEDARENVFNLNDEWIIKGADGNPRKRKRYYAFHPGHQLRLKSSYTDKEQNYVRWINYETGETGVYFEDGYGKWERLSFTSREDNVSITCIKKSSKNQLINMTVEIDDITDMCKGPGEIEALRYKKLAADDCSYIAQAVHYPSFESSELHDGGYCGVTYIIAEGEKAVKSKVSTYSVDPMLIGQSVSIKIENAESVYLITCLDRTFKMTGEEDCIDAFVKMHNYELIDKLVCHIRAVKDKYTKGDTFCYDEALKATSTIQKNEFNRVSFNLSGDEEYADKDNRELIEIQRKSPDRINHEFLRRAYEQARHAFIACGGMAPPRLYGMWTGEWKSAWNSIWTVDANVNLQVSGMNTGNFTLPQIGYITFILRHMPDFMDNARMTYSMHDAIQLPHNIDADRAMMIQYDKAYPFQYWNAGASWCILPIFEYWQCFGNRKIPINEYMRFDNLKSVLSVKDGGLTDEEFDEIKKRGYLDLERDVLLPLLTKAANFWEQIVTPRYFVNQVKKACHDESKTKLAKGERYMIIPALSPENRPKNYNSGITANATMDIAAARDCLDMVCAMEIAVGREESAKMIERWQRLKEHIVGYMTDTDGALKEWAMNEYDENNTHRHLSHLYPAWPAYETQNDKKLSLAANIALDNRNKHNSDSLTAGHGRIHEALIEARLKRGDSVEASLLKMMSSGAYYHSLMTDHDTNGRFDAYCSDTAFGSMGVVNEALVFSNTGEIELLPALPDDWSKGSICGLVTRTQAEVSFLSWDINERTVKVRIKSQKNNNEIKLKCRRKWRRAVVNGVFAEAKRGENENYIAINLDSTGEAIVEFLLNGK